jgi:hypothetical protein
MIQFRSRPSVDSRRRGAQLFVAWSAAHSYFNGAEHAYLKIESAFFPNAETGEQRRAIGVGELAPVVSNMSFAIELLLKVHVWQEFSSPADGHHLPKLWSKLSQAQREKTTHKYRELRPRHIAQRPNMGKVSVAPGSDAGSDKEESAVDAETGLRELNKSFEKWRYMHQALERFPEALSFNFLTAFTLAHAINDCIKEYKGDKKVEATIALNG